MLVTLIFSWLLIEKRNAILSNLPGQVQKLWSDWELQVLVLLSLLFQVVLILLGDLRKRIAKKPIGFCIWVAYLIADFVATYALGVLSKSLGQTHTDELRALWAPFLLLHLGGPDTITAYALEDNELWLRHLLQLVTQASVAGYVVFRSWTGITRVSILTILMFVTGIIKYGERTWALRSASKEQFRDSLLTDPDPGPNYAKFMEGYVSKQDEGFLVHVESIMEDRLKLKTEDHQGDTSSEVASKNNDAPTHNLPPQKILKKARVLFQTFKRLFADLILSVRDGEESKKFIQESSAEDAFQVLEIELGFMFDVLYTKAPLLYTRTGGILRSICYSLTIFVFVFFVTTVGFNPKKHQYQAVDIVTTHLLLIVAIILEIYALITLLCSDWVMSSLIPEKPKRPSSCMSGLVDRRIKGKKRWSNSMGQNNLISYCNQKELPRCIRKPLEIFKVQEMILLCRNSSSKKVPKMLKEKIFEELRSMADVKDDQAKRLNPIGTMDLLSGANLQELLGWSIGVEFHQSILLWHIATDLCYYSDQSPSSTESSCANTCCRTKMDICKLISNYMLHLLLSRPFLLPEGIGQIRYRDTCAEAKELFEGKKTGLSEEEARELLLKVNTDIPPVKVKGDRSKSVLFDACTLAKILESLEKKQRWDTITDVWVKTLSYTASQCRGATHAKQLSRGGELLTHVWLLMAHLSITQQFQISQGKVRAKLIFE